MQFTPLPRRIRHQSSRSTFTAASGAPPTMRFNHRHRPLSLSLLTTSPLPRQTTEPGGTFGGQRRGSAAANADRPPRRIVVVVGGGGGGAFVQRRPAPPVVVLLPAWLVDNIGANAVMLPEAALL